MVECVAVSGAHIIHTDGGDGLQAWVDLGGADGEAAAAADADRADLLAVDEGASAQIIDCRAEGFGIEVGRNRVAGLALAVAPEAEVDGEGNKALLRHFCGVKVGALLFNCAHGVADDDGGVLLVFIHTLGQIQMTGDVHLILVFEGDLLYGHGVAFVKIVGAVGHIGSVSAAYSGGR